MTDYTKLYQRLWREIQKQDGHLTESTGRFVSELVKKLKAEGWSISKDAEQALNDYLSSVRGSVKSGIQTAVSVAAADGLLQSADVLKLTEQAFSKRWPDGLTLSDRLWRLDKDTRQGLTDVLQQGARQVQSVNRIVMSMQRTIERNHAGQRFKIITEHQDDWVKDLHKAAQDMIHNPEGKTAWRDVVAEVEDRILQLSKTGTRTAAEQVLKKIREAADKGREDLLDKAVKWWVYDKQLYNLKRIARTEMSTAMHRAVIASTDADSDIIGYQWRLSSSHPRPDICDYYASVEMGLGKGVWSKDAVPNEKAHPHCMCLLIPRVSKIKTKGHGDFQSFMENLQPEQQAKLMPKWAKNLTALGKDVNDLVRPDGLWLKSRKQFIAKVGEDKFKAGQALGQAVLHKRWGELNPKTHKAGMRKTIKALSPFRDNNEVDRMLTRLEQGKSVSLLDSHYLTRRFVDGEPFRSKQDYVTLIDETLTGHENKIYRQQSKNHVRYVVYNENSRWAAIVDAQGKQYVTAFRLAERIEPGLFGDYLWHVNDLMH